MPTKLKLPVTGNDEADLLLEKDPLALVIGMLLDQQVPMEWAFWAPLALKERLGGSLDAAAIAAMDLDELKVVFKGPRALHRYHGSMATRTQQLCQHLVDHHKGDAARLWKGVKDPRQLYANIAALPGFGHDKSRIFNALLAKRFGRAPEGWQEFSGPFADATPRSVADIDSPAALQQVRAYKKEMKAQGKSRED